MLYAIASKMLFLAFGRAVLYLDYLFVFALCERKNEKNE